MQYRFQMEYRQVSPGPQTKHPGFPKAVMEPTTSTPLDVMTCEKYCVTTSGFASPTTTDAPILPCMSSFTWRSEYRRSIKHFVKCARSHIHDRAAYDQSFGFQYFPESHLKSSLSTHTLVYAHLRHAMQGPTFISESFTNSASAPVASMTALTRASVLLFLTGLPLIPRTSNGI